MDYRNAIENIETQLGNYMGNKNAIIGISGGVDSALVADLCTNVLGYDRVMGVMLPYGNEDTRDAQRVIDNLGINGTEVNIQENVDRDVEQLEEKLGKELFPVTRGNVMARERMNLLYGFSREMNGTVIGTGNKTEIMIGYLTKYGDGGVDIEPIGDLYKTEVFEIAKQRGLPEENVNKKPSAGFWEGQTDEDELGMSYEVIDGVLKGEITKGDEYEKVQRLIENSQHKRETPKVFKVR